MHKSRSMERCYTLPFISRNIISFNLVRWVPINPKTPNSIDVFASGQSSCSECTSCVIHACSLVPTLILYIIPLNLFAVILFRFLIATNHINPIRQCSCTYCFHGWMQMCNYFPSVLINIISLNWCKALLLLTVISSNSIHFLIGSKNQSKFLSSTDHISEALHLTSDMIFLRNKISPFWLKT